MLDFSEEEMRRKDWIELSPPEDAAKDRAFFVQLRAGSIYRGSRMPQPEDHLVSRMREIRTHGLNGGRTHNAAFARRNK